MSKKFVKNSPSVDDIAIGPVGPISPVSPFGLVGPKGDTGQAKPIETNYEAILFASYAQAHYS